MGVRASSRSMRPAGGSSRPARPRQRRARAAQPARVVVMRPEGHRPAGRSLVQEADVGTPPEACRRTSHGPAASRSRHRASRRLVRGVDGRPRRPARSRPVRSSCPAASAALTGAGARRSADGITTRSGASRQRRVPAPPSASMSRPVPGGHDPAVGHGQRLHPAEAGCAGERGDATVDDEVAVARAAQTRVVDRRREPLGRAGRSPAPRPSARATRALGPLSVPARMAPASSQVRPPPGKP